MENIHDAITRVAARALERMFSGHGFEYVLDQIIDEGATYGYDDATRPAAEQRTRHLRVTQTETDEEIKTWARTHFHMTVTAGKQTLHRCVSDIFTAYAARRRDQRILDLTVGATIDKPSVWLIITDCKLVQNQIIRDRATIPYPVYSTVDNATIARATLGNHPRDYIYEAVEGVTTDHVTYLLRSGPMQGPAS